MTDRDSSIDGEQIEHMTRAVMELSEETRVLRMAIDELRDDVVHVLRNAVHDGLLAACALSRTCPSIHWSTISETRSTPFRRSKSKRFARI